MKKIGIFVLTAYLFTMIVGCARQDKSLARRISEELYVKEASVKWRYFKGLNHYVWNILPSGKMKS